MITLGFTFSYSDNAVADTAFPYVSTYLLVGVSGDLVFEAPDGSAQWVRSCPVGYNPIAAKRILTSGTVNGTPRTTTASNIVYCCAPKY